MTEAARETSLPPTVAVLQMLTGKWISQSISVVASLGVADHLGDGPKTSEALAKLCGAQPRALHRVLRALCTVGIFAEDAEGRFGQTELSSALATDAPGSMRSMAIFFGDHPTWAAWGELEHSVRTGEPAFEKVLGTPYFKYLAAHPESSRHFNAAMTGFSIQEVAAIHEAFDFSSVETLVDVAGGQGALLSSTLIKNPNQKGILFDQPGVIEGARAGIEREGLAGRCELIAGSFFESIPSGADGYMMKHILHDWNDADAIAILKNIHRAAAPGAKLFVIDAVIEPGNEPGFAKLMDLEMLVLYNGGRERTQRELVSLFEASGFELVRVVPTDSPASVIEARRA
jgi:hypothetical protein